MAQGADAGAIIAGSVVLAAVLVAVVPGPGDRMGQGQGNLKTGTGAGIRKMIEPSMGAGRVGGACGRGVVVQAW